MLNDTIDRTIELLQKVREKITDDSDTVWTRFDSPKEMRDVIDEHIHALGENDLSKIDALDLLFGPTGALQEHSISNGWGNEFLDLSATFDEYYRKLKKLR